MAASIEGMQLRRSSVDSRHQRLNSLTRGSMVVLKWIRMRSPSYCGEKGRRKQGRGEGRKNSTTCTGRQRIVCGMMVRDLRLRDFVLRSALLGVC